MVRKEGDFWCEGTKKKEHAGMYHLHELGLSHELLSSVSVLLLSLCCAGFYHVVYNGLLNAQKSVEPVTRLIKCFPTIYLITV